MQRFLAIMILPLVGLVLPGSAQETVPSFEDSAGQDEPFDFLDGLDTSTLGGMGSMGDSDILLSATLKVEQDGRNGILEVKATLAPQWHTYAMDQEGGPGPSKIAVKSADKIEMLAPFRPDRQPKVREVKEFDVPLREHYEEVIWSAPVRLAEGVDAETLELEAQYDGLICNDATGCKPIFGRMVSVAFGGYYEPTTRAAAVPKLDLDNLDLSRSEQAERSLVLILGIAFVGGFILNFMPCVLPVIGLKVMSFVQQAGENRAKVFALNLWYSFGLVSVFAVLATLVVVWHFGWGEIFTKSTFRITMAAVVFTMGLSFLGVWEIPIPGFVGSGKAAELADKEGPAGAFAKGILTTILSTPCSGPAVATAMVYCMNKPAPIVYTVFLAMGLGMASPYLVIGAHPKLARFIPKPGAWMETFKQTMGFVLLATVVFILTFLRWTNVMPTLALLFGLWAACWWIARTPVTARFNVKLRAWLAAAAFAVLIGLVAFGERLNIGQFTLYGLQGSMESRFSADVEKEVDTRIASRGASADPLAARPNEDKASELPWEPFSQRKLERLTADNKTVLVDFTANWCLTCKMLEVSVLNTTDIRRIVDKNDIVTLVADWSDGAPEISKLLEALGGKQVPVVAIFPAGRPNQPLVMRGFYTKQDLIDNLQEAGPSKKNGNDVAGIAADGS